MEKINSLAELRVQIAILENKRELEKLALKQKLNDTMDSLSPSALIKSALHNITSAPDLKGDLLNTAISLAAGYFTKKVAVGETHNPLKNIMGTLLQVGVTALVSKNAEVLKTFFKKVVEKFGNKTEENKGEEHS
jgi:hypothetical protein